MIDINDPDMKEIVIEFCDESDSLIEELNDYLDKFEDDPSTGDLLEKYGQTIDRIMGAAKTLGLNEIGSLCQMGKIIGYKGSQAEKLALKEVVGGVLFDLTDLLQVLVSNVRSGESEHDFNLKAFNDRLIWLNDKLKHIDRSSCSFDEVEQRKSKEKTTTTAQLDKLISQFNKAGIR